MEIEGTEEQNKDFQEKLSIAERFNWFERLDELIAEEDLALEALKKAIK